MPVMSSAPAGELLVDRLGVVEVGLRHRHLVVALAVDLVGDADRDLLPAGEHVELGQHEVGDAVDPHGVARDRRRRTSRSGAAGRWWCRTRRRSSAAARRRRRTARSGTGPRRRAWCRPWRSPMHAVDRGRARCRRRCTRRRRSRSTRSRTGRCRGRRRAGCAWPPSSSTVLPASERVVEQQRGVGDHRAQPLGVARAAPRRSRRR